MTRLSRLYYLVAVIPHGKQPLDPTQLAGFRSADMPASHEPLKRERELRSWLQRDLAAQLARS